MIDHLGRQPDPEVDRHARADFSGDTAYVITRIIFKCEKIKAPFAIIDKLRCKLDLMNMTVTGPDYRTHALIRMNDRYRHVIINEEERIQDTTL